MSVLLEAFARQLDALQDAPNLDVRRAALQVARESGLPHGRVEAWKYTSLRAVERRQPVASSVGVVDEAVLARIPAPRVVFINGHYSADASDLTGLPRGLDVQLTNEASSMHLDGDAVAHVFNHVNTALNQGGVRIAVSEPTDVPVHVAWIATALEASDVSQHNVHQVDVRDNASMTLVEHVLSAGAHKHLATNRFVVNLGEASKMTHVRAQMDTDTATWFARTEVNVAARADYRRLDLEVGAGLSRHELVFEISGDEAAVSSNGILLGQSKRHLDTRLSIAHRALHSRCDLNWRGLGAERSRIAFHGGIVIAAGADHTEAMLSNRNLLLSESAEIDTQPVLEIYADEVVAAHGATVGQLDANALFYLQSRGIDAKTAKTMLIAAFCHEMLAIVEQTSLRDWLGARLDLALSQLELA